MPSKMKNEARERSLEEAVLTPPKKNTSMPMTRDTSDKLASSGKYLSGCEMDDGRRKEPSTKGRRSASLACEDYYDLLEDHCIVQARHNTLSLKLSKRVQ